MSPQFDQLTTQALALSPEERVELAQRLWDSVDCLTDDDAELFAEIERREAEINSGKVKPIPYDQAMRRNSRIVAMNLEIAPFGESSARYYPMAATLIPRSLAEPDHTPTARVWAEAAITARKAIEPARHIILRPPPSTRAPVSVSRGTILSRENKSQFRAAPLPGRRKRERDSSAGWN